MTDSRINSNGNVTFWWVPDGGIANHRAPAAAEINAGQLLGDGVSWNDFDLGPQASDTNDDPPMSAKAKATTLGADKYGGHISFYYPAVYDDNTNIYSKIENLFRVPGVVGYLVVRIDGETAATGTTQFPQINTAQPGDLVHVFYVKSDGQSDTITGDGVKLRYTINFLQQGKDDIYTVVTAGTSPTVAITPLTFTLATGNTHTVLKATVNGRDMTRAVTWSSSDPTKATVSKNGVVTRISAGTVNITANYPATGTAAAAPSVGTIS